MEPPGLLYSDLMCCLNIQVRLKDSVVSALDFYKARDAELAWIDAVLDLTAAKTDTSAKYEAEPGEVSEDKKGETHSQHEQTLMACLSI